MNLISVHWLNSIAASAIVGRRKFSHAAVFVTGELFLIRVCIIVLVWELLTLPFLQLQQKVARGPIRIAKQAYELREKGCQFQANVRICELLIALQFLNCLPDCHFNLLQFCDQCSAVECLRA
jgi:hypothetical protein